MSGVFLWSSPERGLIDDHNKYLGDALVLLRMESSAVYLQLKTNLFVDRSVFSSTEDWASSVVAQVD